jgi:DAHP synthase ferredoxin-like domain
LLIIMKRSADESALDHVKEFLINRNFDLHQSTGANRTIIGVIGDTATLDPLEIEKMAGVLQVVRIAREEE